MWAREKRSRNIRDSAGTKRFAYSREVSSGSGASGEAEELFSALQHLKYAKHEVILFHVVDQKRELDFQFENRPYVFVDLETGEKVKLQSNQVKDYYVEQVQKYKQQLKMKCAQFKIDFVEADINKDFKQVLLPYLMKRTKMM